MRLTAVPARPSRKVLTTGIAAPTAASKFSAPPNCSAAFASLSPCLAINALLAVTTDLPDFSAASMADKAGSPAPPINSTKQSILGLFASSSGLFAHSTPCRSRPRFLAFERAVTATTRTARPLRNESVRLCCSIRRTTSAPTVPSPAIPTFRGATMTSKDLQEKLLRHDLVRKPEVHFSGSCLPPVGERNHVVQCFDAAFKEAAHPAGGLPDPLLVFHHGDAHIALAVLPKGHAGRNHDARFLDHQGGKLHAADFAEG